MAPGSPGIVVAVVGSREKWPAAIAASVSSWLISFLRRICQKSSDRLVRGSGSQMMPAFQLNDFSGCRFGLGEVINAIGAGSQATVTPSAQRVGSVAVENAARPPRPFSAGLGARKPRAQVPRNASEG